MPDHEATGGTDPATILTRPKPQVVHGPGSVEWAVRGPDGHRSLTWLVKATVSGDIYIGARELIGTVRLSLLQGSWLMAFTGEFTRRRLPPEQNQSISDYWVTAPIVDGWRLAAVIATPSTTLGERLDEKLSDDGSSIQWWDAPSPPEHLEVQVLVGQADRERPILTDTVGTVGEISLTSGRVVWVAARRRTLHSHTKQFLAAHHAYATRYPHYESGGFAWGDTDDVPRLIDMAVLRADRRPVR